ncbi:hypothetical protein FERRO_06180 [Ferrovum sp. JA12]|uniref:P-type conjugative transfer protein TrbJ n=1 Tax=Ferrovum sp. JA12 TaxID=1356299 RepID=UPI000702EB22|nr:P-type conjugative transfer protein TrbJ [Ferrovum sp. JA12]KRH79550.1 hypothetical protein FERRO_06180 [Ferrovum sp. JA12]
MKKRLLTLALLAVMTNANNPAYAVFCANCATEWTQVLNRIQLAAQYAKQVDQYTTQLQEYQAQLRNLELNPTSIMSSDVSRLMNGIGSIMQSGQSIGGSMAKIDENFTKEFKNPLDGNFSEKFKTWTTASQDTLGAAMRSAGMHRDSFASDTEALTALFNKTQTSQGTVAAVQTMSEINVMQVQQMQKLQDLIATQNIATSNYMAGQNAKAQAAVDGDSAIQKGFLAIKPKELPKLDTSQKTYKKWDLFQ